MTSLIAFAKRTHQLPSTADSRNKNVNSSPTSKTKGIIHNNSNQNNNQFVSAGAQQLSLSPNSAALQLSNAAANNSVSSPSQQQQPDYKEKTGHVVIPREIGLPGTSPSLLLIFFEESLVTPKERRTARDDDGRTLLHLSCLKAAPLSFMEELIVEHKIHVNVVDYAGNTPLHYSARVKAHEHTKLLLRYGADGTLMNGAGEVPDVAFLAKEFSASPNIRLSPSFSNVNGNTMSNNNNVTTTSGAYENEGGMSAKEESAFFPSASFLSPKTAGRNNHQNSLVRAVSMSFSSPNSLLNIPSPLGSAISQESKQQQQQQAITTKELLAKCNDPPHYVPNLLISSRVSLFAAPPPPHEVFSLPVGEGSIISSSSADQQKRAAEAETVDEEEENQDQKKERKNHAALISEAAQVARMEVSVPMVPLPWNAPPPACISNFDNVNSARNRRRSSAIAARASKQHHNHNILVTLPKSSVVDVAVPQGSNVMSPKKPILSLGKPPVSSPRKRKPVTRRHPLLSRSSAIIKKCYGSDHDNENDDDEYYDEYNDGFLDDRHDEELFDFGRRRQNQNETKQTVEGTKAEEDDQEEEEEEEDIFAKSKKYYQLLEKNKKKYSLTPNVEDHQSTATATISNGKPKTTTASDDFASNSSGVADFNDDEESKRRRRSIAILHSLPVWFAVIPRVSEMELQSGFLVGGMLRFHGEFQFDGMPFALAEIQLYEDIFCARFTSTLSATAQNLHNNHAALHASGSLHLNAAGGGENDAIDEDPIVVELFTSTKDTSMPTVVRCFRDTNGVIAALEKRREEQRQGALLRRKQLLAAKRLTSAVSALSSSPTAANKNSASLLSSGSHPLIQTTEAKAASLLKRFMRRLLFLGKFQSIISLLATKALMVRKFLRRCVYRSKFAKAILFHVAASFFRYAMMELERFSERSSSGPYKAIAKVVRSFVETFTDQRFVTRSLLYSAVESAFKARQQRLMAIIKKHRNILFPPKRSQSPSGTRSSSSENHNHHHHHHNHHHQIVVALEHIIPSLRQRSPWSVSLEEIIGFCVQPMSRRELLPVIAVAEQRDGGMMPRNLLYQIRQLPHAKEMFEDMSRNKVKSTLVDLVTCFRGRKNYFEERLMKWDKIMLSKNQNHRKNASKNSATEATSPKLDASQNYRQNKDFDDDNYDDSDNADEHDEQLEKILDAQRASLSASMMKGATGMRLIDLFSSSMSASAAAIVPPPVSSSPLNLTTPRPNTTSLPVSLPLVLLPPWINQDRLANTDISNRKLVPMKPIPPRTVSHSAGRKRTENHEQNVIKNNESEEIYPSAAAPAASRHHPSFLTSQQSTVEISQIGRKSKTIPLGKQKK